MRPPSMHANFFSSLKQVEKRLKLEEPPDSRPSTTSRAIQDSNYSQPMGSLSTPIYLLSVQPSNNTTMNTPQESSEPPSAFLSSSPHLPIDTETETPLRRNPLGSETKDTGGDIENLIQILGFSGYGLENGEKRKKNVVFCGGDSCGCECGFYENVVGVKGPKCKKEVERMKGWIRYFMENGKEPLRLAFLLLGKSAFESDDDCSSGALEFPSAVQEFLKNDPPKT